MSPLRKQIYDLVGESHRNTDGSDRQNLLRGCCPGDGVLLVREPKNSYDKNAILVVSSSTGKGLGYLKRDDAAILAQAMDAGSSLKAQIHELRGGLPEYPSFGCRICVVGELGNFRTVKPFQPDQSLYSANAGSPSARQSSRRGNGKSILTTFLKKLFR